MRQRRHFALAALPGAAAIALWSGYRRAVAGFRTGEIPPPRLPGRVHVVKTSWGRLTYRRLEGSIPGPALLLLHGWGRSADSVWWNLLGHTERTVIALDLPGHGRSTLHRRFTFDLAARAIGTAMEHAALQRPILVAHSMGGPVALTAFRRTSPAAFGGFVAVATSAYWVRPRHQVIVGAAPYVLAPSSPIVTGAMRTDVKVDPTAASQVAKSYALRPSRRVLLESATELKRFDARGWSSVDLPPAVWIVTALDRVIPAEDQRASADHLGAPVVELHADHPVAVTSPAMVSDIIEERLRAWSSWPQRRLMGRRETDSV